MRHETLIGSSIFKGGGIIFVVELPKCQFLEFFFSWPSQFAGEESSFISGLGGKNFDATILGTKLGKKAGFQQAFSQSPYFHSTSHPFLCPWDRSTQWQSPHYPPSWRDHGRQQGTTPPASSPNPLHASPTWHLNSHSGGTLTIFTVLPGVACQTGALVRSGVVKKASAIMETRRRGTRCKRKGNFSQCPCAVSQFLQASGLSLVSLLAIF